MADEEKRSYVEPWSNTPKATAAREKFYAAIGEAMAAWSSVEDGLFEWFKRCTAMHETLARAVFYSARSFEGRRDMLEAAIPFSPFDEKTQISIRKCLLRAGQYAAFRNRIAHRHMLFTYEIKPPQFVLVEGRTLSGASANYVTIEALKIATHNFRRLADCILAFHPEWQEPSVCEQGCLEEILSLPTAADSTEPSQ
jgi:hypothetical protein